MRQQERIGQLLLAEAAARYHPRSEHITATGSSIRCQPQLQPSLLGRSATMKRLWLQRPLVTAALVLLALVVFFGGNAFALGQINPVLPGGYRLVRPSDVTPHYTSLNLSHAVGDTNITLTTAALTAKNVVIGYTYDTPVQSEQSGTVCPLSLASSEGDTFRVLPGDYLPEGKPSGLSHGSVLLYFMVDHLEGTPQARHLHLLLHLCDSSQSVDPVAFDFTVPLQK
jgi:hypothetical protein